jgi:hypothetical protein
MVPPRESGNEEGRRIPDKYRITKLRQEGVERVLNFG